MDERQLGEALNVCIDRLAMGDSIEDCLKMYPEYADVLRPLLYAGIASGRAAYSAQEVSAAKSRARLRFEQVLVAPLGRPRPARWLSTVVALAAAFVLVLTGLVMAAQSSLPGEPLWGLKRLTETVQLALPGGDAQRDQFAQRRIEEIALLLVRKQVATVTFEGIVEQISGEDWRVASLPVRVLQSVVDSQLTQVGDLVSITGDTTTEGVLAASSVVNLTRESLMPPPTPTSTPPPSMTPAPTSTLAPTPTTTHTVTPSLPPSASPTSMPSPTPTATMTVCAPTRPSDWVTYSVRAGDTLTALAAATGVSLQTLVEVNCIADEGLLVVGQVIYLPQVPAQIAPTSAGDTGGDTDGSTGSVSPPESNDNQSEANDNHEDHSDNDNDDDTDNSNSGSGSGSSGSGGSDDSGDD